MERFLTLKHPSLYIKAQVDKVKIISPPLPTFKFSTINLMHFLQVTTAVYLLNHLEGQTYYF